MQAIQLSKMQNEVKWNADGMYWSGHRLPALSGCPGKTWHQNGVSRVSVSSSVVWLFVTPWTVALQAPLSMEFSRQEYWSGLPFPFPGGLPDLWTQVSCTAGGFFPIWGTREAGLHGHLAASQNLSLNALWPSISTFTVFSHINGYLKNLHNCTDAHTGSYVAALFTTVRSWKQTAGWWWYIHKTKMIWWGSSEWGNCQVRKHVSWLDEKNKWERAYKACPEF